MTDISKYEPRKMFYIPQSGQVVYLAEDYRLLDTGLDISCIPNSQTLPKLTEDEVWEWEESHGQHN